MITILGMAGRNVTIPYPPKRVIVMNGWIAEVMLCLGAEDRIVGRKNFIIEENDGYSLTYKTMIYRDEIFKVLMILERPRGVYG